MTSLYNFQGAYPNTAIDLSCAVTGYTDFSGVRSTPAPAGLACGFGATSVTLGTSGFATQTLVVGAANGYTIASNTVPALPANRWWIATGGTTLACIFLLGLPARRRNWQSMVGAVILAAVGFGIAGCGATVASGPAQQYYNSLNGANPGSSSQASTPTVPAGIYTVLVTATASANTSITHTLPVQVLVGMPAVTITPPSTTIAKGGSVTLTVVATSANVVAISGSDGSTYTLSAAGGTQVVKPTATTTYTATAMGTDGQATAVSTITVQ